MDLLVNILALPKEIKIGSLRITFYAICIFIGAIIAYVLSRYFTKKEGYDDTILEGTFYLAFPLGIVGARIWYVIAEWSKEFANRDFWHVFAFWEGGLAIQGGAILGVLVGVLYVHYKKPHYNVLAMADFVVPNILVAQAIGRWGNFFNQEVYGAATEPGGWKIFGNWFVNQMTIDGQFRTPLFLIEGIVNIIGFVLIMFVIRKFLRKYLKPGYLCSCYFIWYGLTRAILEPLRDNQYKMGSKVMASQVMAYIFIICGILAIIGLYFLDKHLKKNKNEKIETSNNVVENFFEITSSENMEIVNKEENNNYETGDK